MKRTIELNFEKMESNSGQIPTDAHVNITNNKNIIVPRHSKKHAESSNQGDGDHLGGNDKTVWVKFIDKFFEE
jgi:hypothetical protein